MKIKLIKADITKIEVDIIVNAANSSLLGGGGVDGAIHRAGGKTILEECQVIRNRQGKCKTGEAVITTAGNLPAKRGGGRYRCLERAGAVDPVTADWRAVCR